MNPLTHALKLAENPPPEADARTADQSTDRTADELGEFGPLRATRDGAAVDAAIHGAEFAAPEPPGPIPAACGGMPSDSAGTAASDADGTRAVERDGFRSLPGSRGIGRGIGIAVSMLVAAGAAAGGGAFLWKTELTRPALVRGLPPRQEAAVEPARTHAGSVAADAREPTGAVASAPHDPAAVFAAGPDDGIRPDRPAEATESGNPPGRSATAENGEGIPMLATTPRGEGHPTPQTTAEAVALPAGNNAPEGEPDETVAMASGSGRHIVITKRTHADHVAQSLERAYRAYLAGDGEAAGQAYRSVLRHEPRNRDARLGLAAVAAQAGRQDEAAEHYTTLLASHPADTTARAALIAIAEGDPTRVESGLKALLRIEPEAAHLHFSLGNLYAAESRWPEAQRAWFRAYRLERGNADHAYNLAVGLDHLSQPRNALALYREALVLAQGTRTGFETEAVRERIRILESRTDAD